MLNPKGINRRYTMRRFMFFVSLFTFLSLSIGAMENNQSQLAPIPGIKKVTPLSLHQMNRFNSACSHECRFTPQKLLEVCPCATFAGFRDDQKRLSQLLQTTDIPNEHSLNQQEFNEIAVIFKKAIQFAQLIEGNISDEENADGYTVDHCSQIYAQFIASRVSLEQTSAEQEVIAHAPEEQSTGMNKAKDWVSNIFRPRAVVKVK